MSRIRFAALCIFSVVALATAGSFAATSKPQPAPKAQAAQPGDDEGDWDDRDGDRGGWADRDEGRGGWDHRGPGHGWRGGGFEDHGPGHRHFHGGHRGMGGRMLAFRAANSPSASVLRDLAGLERMYRRNGHEQDIPGLYRDVLARTNDPVVRHMAGQRLARLEWQAGNKDAAVEQMKKNLDADLKRLK